MNRPHSTRASEGNLTELCLINEVKYYDNAVVSEINEIKHFLYLHKQFITTYKIVHNLCIFSDS